MAEILRSERREIKKHGVSQLGVDTLRFQLGFSPNSGLWVESQGGRQAGALNQAANGLGLTLVWLESLQI